MKIEDFTLRVSGARLAATLAIPADPRGLVMFVHSTGSSRISPRDGHVARLLRAERFATLMFDLRSPEERIASDGNLDLERLAERVVEVTEWVHAVSEVGTLPRAYFGASTGLAIALVAAARRPGLVRAIAGRGGRPDLVAPWLRQVKAPVLLIVAEQDPYILELNRVAAETMGSRCEVAIVPDASHLFVERGALDHVARLAGEWFGRHLATSHPRFAVSLPFADRREAGALLARPLARYAHPGTLVFGLARGGLPVADEVARALRLPLDVWLARKIGVPAQPEIGMGAVAEGASLVIDDEMVQWSETPPAELRTIVHREISAIRERAALYRDGRSRPDVRGRTVILVDDGIATGGTLRAAAHAARRCGAAHVILAAPVGAADAVAQLRGEADAVICLAAPEQLGAVGQWYTRFDQVDDSEVIEILHGSHLAA